MDPSIAFGLLLALAAVAVTVTPRIQNGWVAAIAWLLTAAYGVWLIRTQREPITTFVGQNPWQTTFLASLVAAVAAGGVWRNVVVPYTQGRPTAEATAAASISTSATADDSAPRLALERYDSFSSSKLVGNSSETLAAQQISYAKITIKNDPLRAGPDGIAKNVTANVVFFSPVGHHLTVEGDWDKEKPVTPSNVIDNFSGRGTSVWFNIGQRRDLFLAFKLPEDDNAYAVKEQPYANELEVRAPGLALPGGDYRVVVEVRSRTSAIREDFEFRLRHTGRGSVLELSPITR